MEDEVAEWKRRSLALCSARAGLNPIPVVFWHVCLRGLGSVYLNFAVQVVTVQGSVAQWIACWTSRLVVWCDLKVAGPSPARVVNFYVCVLLD